GNTIRGRYRALCLSRLDKTFYEPISRWCEDHGIALTGHPSQSDDIGLLRRFHIPGQDLVLRKVAPENEMGLFGRDSTLAKCAADAARHAGRRRNSVECFGCCVRNNPSAGWDLPPEDMKWYIDWMAVRGVNLFMPHAFYYSLEGKRAYERPPDVGPAQTWWSEYGIWARYMSRLSALMTDAATMTDIAVLCTDSSLPYKIAASLYRHQIDFNYLEERFLELSMCGSADGKINVGDYVYRTILVEDPALFGAKTLQQLESLKSAGLAVIHPNPETSQWIEALRPYSPFKTVGYHPDLRLTRQQKDGFIVLLMVNEGDAELAFELDCKTEGMPMIWDPWTGGFGKTAIVRTSLSSFTIPLNLPFRRSLVLIITDKENEENITHYKDSLGTFSINPATVMDISQGWKLDIPAAGFQAAIQKPEDWQVLLPDSHFSGSALYEKTFDLPSAVDKATVLDLGELFDAVAVDLNGKRAGTLFWHPYRLDLTDAAVKGTNTLRLKVMNSISCRMDRISKPSGLIGPVRIIQFDREE
ncbi:MAG: glycosylhydrolase-like jelly roll fold domain-containing protein, partial [Saccharofermentanales bacterium]